MPDIIQETPEIAPAPDTTIPAETPPSQDDQPLSAHIEEYHADKVEPETPEPGKRRHRSYKNQARPEDVPRIKALTSEIAEWKAKYEAATKPAPEAPKPEPPKYVAPPVEPSKTFDEPEPTLDDPKYSTSNDPYSAWQRDLARYDRKKEAFDADQAKVKDSQTQVDQQIEAGIKARAARYTDQLNAYVQEHPDRAQAFRDVAQQYGGVNSPLMLEAIWAMENGPDVVYSLRQSPALLDELLLLTSGKPVSEVNVAATTNWLRTRLQAGTTGAAVRGSTQPAPRPPTPVRSPPMSPPSGPPGDSGSLMEHQRFFKTAK